MNNNKINNSEAFIQEDFLYNEACLIDLDCLVFD